MNERMHARPWLAHTQEDYARMLLARGADGDAEKAEILKAQALETYGALGIARQLRPAQSSGAGLRP